MTKNQDQDNLGDSLLSSVAHAGVAEIAGDVSEMALDAVLDEGLLKDIPIFGWVAKLYGVSRTIRDQLFLKKVASFLLGSTSATQQERDTFRARMEDDPKFRRKIGETLILLIERHDHFEKSTILGRVFAEFMRGEINYETFLRIGTSIDRVPITDLRGLSSYKERLDSSPEGKSGGLNDDTCQSLYTSGLVRSDGVFEVWYHSNDVMATLVKVMNEG
jgi:hypothetical protein